MKKAWREKYFCKVVAVAFLLDGALLLYSIFKYNLGNIVYVQAATWFMILSGVAVVAEEVYYKKLSGEKKDSIANWKDKYYDKMIIAVFLIQWAVLLIGDFQCDIGQYKMIARSMSSALAMAMFVGIYYMFPNAFKPAGKWNGNEQDEEESKISLQQEQ